MSPPSPALCGPCNWAGEESIFLKALQVDVGIRVHARIQPHSDRAHVAAQVEVSWSHHAEVVRAFGISLSESAPDMLHNLTGVSRSISV